jgi:hypothetical protein
MVRHLPAKEEDLAFFILLLQLKHQILASGVRLHSYPKMRKLSELEMSIVF